MDATLMLVSKRHNNLSKKSIKPLMEELMLEFVGNVQDHWW